MSERVQSVEIRTTGCCLLELVPLLRALGEGVLDSSSTVAGEGRVTSAVVTEVTGLHDVAFSPRLDSSSGDRFELVEVGRSDFKRI